MREHPQPVHLSRLLVANRGEIALRIVRAAKRLGIETVLAASTADRGSIAAREADRTVVIGPPQARDSYLNPQLLLHAAVSAQCNGLHPGYGFLSERSELAQLCADNDIIFVGPRAESIRQVGDKLSARSLARKANVPMVSGSEKVASAEDAVKIAEEIGYPVITKASAGGGGRGMFIARDHAALAQAFDRVSQEAQAAFGDGTLYLERYVENARHLEVQVMGDGAGKVLHFAERDCSIQRRYQKMLEEAPAVILREPVRQRMQNAAVGLLASIGYRNAGTVEFLYDVDRESFYFMEVNARIQVEHPVSEAITGTDLIELQLQLASGRPWPLTQDAIRPRGHAIEARILAEDPLRDFLPSPGRITRWQIPTGEGVRVDTAVEQDSVVPPFYDSMIAKLIVHGADRAQAVARLRAALDSFVVEGVATNLRLLSFIAAHADFAANRFDTRWLERVLLPAWRAAQPAGWSN